MQKIKEIKIPKKFKKSQFFLKNQKKTKPTKTLKNKFYKKINFFKILQKILMTKNPTKIKIRQKNKIEKNFLKRNQIQIKNFKNFAKKEKN